MQTNDISAYFGGLVVDMIGKSQYAPILEAIGCHRTKGDKIFAFLQKHIADYIRDEKFRKGLYDYLSGNQGNFQFDLFPGCCDCIDIILQSCCNDIE